jgi:hypothetical protein
MIITRDPAEFDRYNRQDCVKLLVHQYGYLNDDTVNDIMGVYMVRMLKGKILDRWDPVKGGYSEYVSHQLFWAAGEYWRGEKRQRGYGTVSLDGSDHDPADKEDLGFVLTDYVSWLKKHGAEHTARLLDDMKNHYTGKVSMQGQVKKSLWWRFTESYMQGCAGVTGAAPAF